MIFKHRHRHTHKNADDTLNGRQILKSPLTGKYLENRATITQEIVVLYKTYTNLMQDKKYGASNDNWTNHYT